MMLFDRHGKKNQPPPPEQALAKDGVDPFCDEHFCHNDPDCNEEEEEEEEEDNNKSERARQDQTPSSSWIVRGGLLLLAVVVVAVVVVVVTVRNKGDESSSVPRPIPITTLTPTIAPTRKGDSDVFVNEESLTLAPTVKRSIITTDFTMALSSTTSTQESIVLYEVIPPDTQVTVDLRLPSPSPEYLRVYQIQDRNVYPGSTCPSTDGIFEVVSVPRDTASLQVPLDQTTVLALCDTNTNVLIAQSYYMFVALLSDNDPTTSGSSNNGTFVDAFPDSFVEVVLVDQDDGQDGMSNSSTTNGGVHSSTYGPGVGRDGPGTVVFVTTTTTGPSNTTGPPTRRRLPQNLVALYVAPAQSQVAMGAACPVPNSEFLQPHELFSVTLFVLAGVQDWTVYACDDENVTVAVFLFEYVPLAPSMAPSFRVTSQSSLAPTSDPHASNESLSTISPTTLPTELEFNGTIHFPHSRQYINQICGLTSVGGMSGCRDECLPQFIECCDPFNDFKVFNVTSFLEATGTTLPPTPTVPPAYESCSFSRELGGCLAYAKCQVLSEIIDPAPATLPYLCSPTGLATDPDSCAAACRNSRCCFNEDGLSCLADNLDICLDYAPCQNLRNRANVLMTAPDELDEDCAVGSLRCNTACMNAECCTDRTSRCFQENFLACLTYAPCNSAHDTISIAIPEIFDRLPVPPTELIYACDEYQTVLDPASIETCATYCEQAACCYESDPQSNCFHDDPLGCLLWHQHCQTERDLALSWWTDLGINVPPAASPPNNQTPSVNLPTFPLEPNTIPCVQDPACVHIMGSIDPVYPPQARSRLDTPGTCQNWAREWLRMGKDVTEFSVDRVRQRFTLALLYCEFQGDIWANGDLWLSDLHECDWFTDLDADPCDLGESYKILRLTSRQIHGTIPAELSMMSSLGEITFSDNFLTGPIPTDLVKLSKLYSFSLSFNLLDGEIPEFIWQFENMGHLDLAYNLFYGEIPENIRLPHLTDLFVHNNELGGIIPSTFGSINWERLHLDGNNFSGPIPWDINSARMRELMLHNNRLTGEFPSHSFATQYAGNRSNVEKVTLYLNDIEGDVNEMCRLKTDPTIGKLETFAVDLDKVACDCCTGPP